MTPEELSEYCSHLNALSPSDLFEEWLASKLADIREECWVLTLQPGRENHRTGQRISPAFPFYCDCNAVVQPTEKVLVNADGDKFCDECFDQLNRSKAAWR
jgi:hypothetical protein